VSPVAFQSYLLAAGRFIVGLAGGALMFTHQGWAITALGSAMAAGAFGFQINDVAHVDRTTVPAATIKEPAS
jgi:hypothetical protein